MERLIQIPRNENTAKIELKNIENLCYFYLYSGIQKEWILFCTFAFVRAETHSAKVKQLNFFEYVHVREAVKYYFADFVRKGGGGSTPHIRNPLFAEEKNP